MSVSSVRFEADRTPDGVKKHHKRESVAMLTPNDFFILCILIEDSQKVSYIINTSYIE